MNLEKLKTNAAAWLQKQKGNRRVLLLIGAAALLLMLVLTVDFPQKKELAVQPAAEMQTNDEQAQLCALLSSIKGAGRVQVMITYAESRETVFAADEDAAREERDSGVSQKDKTATVLLKNGDTQSGLVRKELAAKVRGVAVVCEGGADPVLKAQIVSAVCALFDIKSTNVSVAEMAA